VGKLRVKGNEALEEGGIISKGAIVRLQFYVAPTGAHESKFYSLPTTSVVGYWYAAPPGLKNIPADNLYRSLCS
jgi:hypothetical protein